MAILTTLRSVAVTARVRLDAEADERELVVDAFQGELEEFSDVPYKPEVSSWRLMITTAGQVEPGYVPRGARTRRGV